MPDFEPLKRTTSWPENYICVIYEIPRSAFYFIRPLAWRRKWQGHFDWSGRPWRNSHFGSSSLTNRFYGQRHKIFQAASGPLPSHVYDLRLGTATWALTREDW